MENLNRNCDDFKPEIEFGLVREYDMSANLKIEIPFDYYRSSDYHPMTDRIDSKVHDFIESTHYSHRRRGYFTAPFSVRCVLRGQDNKHLFVSHPRLMTAGLIPPCLNFYDLPDCNRLGLYFGLTGSPVFSLMIRVGRLPDDLAAKVKYVDVYVTRQVPAYSYGGGGHRCDYSDVLRSIDTDSPIHDGVDLGDFVLMCRGRYSDSECLPEFKRHYNDARCAQTPVWYVAPNNRLADMLSAETGFFHVASIKAEDIIGRQSFQTVSVPSTVNEWIEYQEILETGPEIHPDEEPGDMQPKSQSSRNAPVHPRSSLSGTCNMLGIYCVAAFRAASVIIETPLLSKTSRHPPVSRQFLKYLSSGISPPLKQRIAPAHPYGRWMSGI